MRKFRILCLILLTLSIVVVAAPSAEAVTIGGGNCSELRPFPANVSGLAVSQPAVTHDDFGQLQAAVIGSDGLVWRAFGDDPRTSFSAWYSLDQPPVGVGSYPAITSVQRDQPANIFVRGSDGKLWERFVTGENASTSDWLQPVGNDGELVSAPAVATRAPGSVDVAVLGTDGQVYQRFFADGLWSSTWIPLGAPPGVEILGSPAVAAGGGDSLHVFVAGTDDKLWQRFYDGGLWSDWFKPLGDTGVLNSGPAAVAPAPGGMTIAVTGTDAGVYVTDFSAAGWTQWQRLGEAGDVIVGGPSLAARPFRLDLFGLGTDNFVYDLAVVCLAPET